MNEKDKEYLEYLRRLCSLKSDSENECDDDNIDWSKNPEDIYVEECEKIRMEQCRILAEKMNKLIGW